MSNEGRIFDAGALGRSYAGLDDLPTKLFDAVVTHPLGDLRRRTSGVLEWRKALLDGRIPDLEALPWPAHEAASAIATELARMGLLRFLRGEPALVDELLLHLLEQTAEGALREPGWAQERLRRLLAEEKERRRGRGLRVASARRWAGARLEGQALGPLQEPTQEQIAAARRWAQERGGEELRAALRSNWEERVRLWNALEEVFGALGELCGWGFDLTRGLLRSTGWIELMRLRKLLEHLPALRELVRVLGRMREGQDGAEVLEPVLAPLRRSSATRVPSPTSVVLGDARGIERSDAIHRMLPSEGVLLTRPVLKRLWHARRAERALLSYRFESPALELADEEREAPEQVQQRKPAAERGPIIVCVDTSGSMEGLPELVSKAVVLETVRTAHAEGRRCDVFAFSGPGQVVEHALSLSAGGVGVLLGFLTTTFSGGTDLTAPISRAVAKLNEHGWTSADLLLITDGEFEVPSALRELVTKARDDKGLRTHGLLVGGSGDTPLRELCEVVHRFSEWAVLVGGRERVAGGAPINEAQDRTLGRTA